MSKLMFSGFKHRWHHICKITYTTHFFKIRRNYESYILINLIIELATNANQLKKFSVVYIRIELRLKTQFFSQNIFNAAHSSYNFAKSIDHTSWRIRTCRGLDLNFVRNTENIPVIHLALIHDSWMQDPRVENN